MPGSVSSVSFGWGLPFLGGNLNSDLGTGDMLGYWSYGQRMVLTLGFLIALLASLCQSTLPMSNDPVVI